MNSIKIKAIGFACYTIKLKEMNLTLNDWQRPTRSLILRHYQLYIKTLLSHSLKMAFTYIL
jgi:hypothetical protein